MILVVNFAQLEDASGRILHCEDVEVEQYYLTLQVSKIALLTLVVEQ